MLNAFSLRITFALFLFSAVQWNVVAAQNLLGNSDVGSEEKYVRYASHLIEIQMEWGSVEQWRDFEFERLSDVIHDSTGRRVTRDELKLMLGKKKYDPSLLKSYDVLAQFLHYPHWTSFKQTVFIKED